MTSNLDPLVSSILDFWFGELDQDGASSSEKSSRWFKKDPEFDSSINRIYGSYLETAAMGAYDRWTSSIEGSAALIVLLDQFSRNIFRGEAKAWIFDPKALSITLMLLERGDILKAPAAYAYFMLLPTMYNTDIKWIYYEL